MIYFLEMEEKNQFLWRYKGELNRDDFQGIDIYKYR